MIAIIGSRKFPFPVFDATIDEVFDRIWKLHDERDGGVPTVVTGDAPGVDTFVYDWCAKRRIDCKPVTCLKPYINTYFLHRDAEIVALTGRYLIAYWDGTSTGTKFTMEYAVLRGKKVMVVNLNGKSCWFGEMK